jgi:hypothetical protein
MPWDMHTNQICRFCYAGKTEDLDYSDPREDASWTLLPRPATEYTEQVGIDIAPIGALYGFHMEIVQDDQMHDDLLGLRLEIVGSALVQTARDLQPWAPPMLRGSWKDKLNSQLQGAYEIFVTWCKDEHINHSQGLFTAASCGKSSATEWATFKGKAYNCAIVSLWLSQEARKHEHIGQHWVLLATTLHAFAAIYAVCTSGSLRLSDREVQQLRAARSAALQGYNALARAAQEQGQWYYKIIPKYHKMDHHLRRCCANRLNPGSHWNFANESFIGILARLCQSTHRFSMQHRAIRRWVAYFVIEFVGDISEGVVCQGSVS